MADAAGVECLLVGDSLGMVCQGLHSTVGVSLETIRYLTESVFRGLHRVQGTAWLIADLPFGSYQESREQALRSATVLMRAGVHMVNLEGGGWTADIVRFLVERGIPVCGHLGLTAQTVHALGGYRVQGKESEAAALLRRHALELQDAGAAMLVLVLEMVPAALAATLTQELQRCATIGIGAGPSTAGQVLVLHDMLGINLGKTPKFVRNFMVGNKGIAQAMQCVFSKSPRHARIARALWSGGASRRPPRCPTGHTELGRVAMATLKSTRWTIPARRLDLRSGAGTWS
jgi:3-methyl-2-oxobutanoate hydroxymethyltransferase